jgi:hypothetical protein
MTGRACIGMMICLTWAGHVVADPPVVTSHSSCHWFQYKPVCPSVGCCPDDYVRKPLPWLSPIACCGGPDDYCRKPFPTNLGVPTCGGPDDYCRKPLPRLLCPPWSPYLRCGPPEAGCLPEKCQ